MTKHKEKENGDKSNIRTWQIFKLGLCDNIKLHILINLCNTVEIYIRSIN